MKLNYFLRMKNQNSYPELQQLQLKLKFYEDQNILAKNFWDFEKSQCEP
jgi:hypothetical protein